MKLLTYLLVALLPAMVWAEPSSDVCENMVWTEVTTDTVGNTITVDGYKFYYGTTSGSYTASLPVTGAPGTQADGEGNPIPVRSAPTATLVPAADGTYYAAMTAVLDNSGNPLESDYSNEILLWVVDGVARVGGVPVPPGMFRLQCSPTAP